MSLLIRRQGAAIVAKKR